jgi:hypothetical protein
MCDEIGEPEPKLKKKKKKKQWLELFDVIDGQQQLWLFFF